MHTYIPDAHGVREKPPTVEIDCICVALCVALCVAV